jgi:toxin ParE1/3/4
VKPLLLWTDQAREDLLDIYLTIGLDSPSAAERVYGKIENRILALRDHPRLGVRRPEIALSARMLVEGSYLILYETHPDTDDGTIEEIEVVRIVHGYRDLGGIF